MGGMRAATDVFGGGMGASAGVFGGYMGSMTDMGGIRFGGFGGGYGGTSAPMESMADMGAPADVYEAIGAPPRVSWPPWSHGANGDEAKDGDDNNFEDVDK
jgi:hypothetical protein